MPKNLDSIEIVEPPIQELSKQRHGFLKTCLTSCLIIVILVTIGIFALKYSLGPGPKNLKKLPDNFPADVPIYDKENIETITFISGRYSTKNYFVTTDRAHYPRRQPVGQFRQPIRIIHQYLARDHHSGLRRTR